MQFGLALPHYDFSIPGENPLRFGTIVEHARAAEALGFDALYVSDHVSLSVERYGGPPGRRASRVARASRSRTRRSAGDGIARPTAA